MLASNFWCEAQAIAISVLDEELLRSPRCSCKTIGCNDALLLKFRITLCCVGDDKINSTSDLAVTCVFG